jgi:4-amino-4-deoxy-L-arabinose transferase-like glycosyltransferase
LFAAVAFVLAPVVQVGSSELMLDIPVAFFCLMAMLSYVLYLDTARARY